MDDTKIQWHPGFVAAMNLELREYWDILTFEKEYNLNTKPLEIDLLVIKKDTSVHIDNEIGSFFKGHNILEYKCPDGHLDIDVLYKSEAYAGLYKSYGETVDAVKADDMTVSILRDTKPSRLFKTLQEHGHRISSIHNGIYFIEGTSVWFPTQIIVTRELDPEEHTWIRALSGKLDEKDIRTLLSNARQLEGKTEKELADSVLEVSVKANKQMIERLMGDDDMCNALMEIMEPKINEIRKANMEKGIQKGRREGIQGTIGVLRKLNYENEEIKLMIMEQYGLTEDETTAFLKP